jgi:hypothetical protein
MLAGVTALSTSPWTLGYWIEASICWLTWLLTSLEGNVEGPYEMEWDEREWVVVVCGVISKDANQRRGKLRQRGRWLEETWLSYMAAVACLSYPTVPLSASPITASRRARWEACRAVPPSQRRTPSPRQDEIIGASHEACLAIRLCR